VNNSARLPLVLLAGSLIGFGQQTPAPKIDSVLAEAQQAQATGDYAAAANDYKQAVRIEPNMPQLWANLGLMQQECGDIAGAIESFQHARRLDPSLYVPNLFLGIDNAHLGKAQEAVPYLLASEKLNKNDPQAPLALGRTYIALRKFHAAAYELERATSLDPKLGAAWFTLGIARLDEVEDEARTMSEEGKESPFSGALYAESLAKQARFSEAASLYKTLLDAKDQPPCLRSDLGFALLRARDHEGASAAFSSELAAHPECGLAILGQARLALDGGETAQAVKLLNELWNRDHGFVESSAAVLLEGLSAEKASAAVGALLGGTNGELPPDLSNALMVAFNLSGQAATNPDLAPPATVNADATTSDGTDRTAQQDYAAGHFEQCVRRLGAKPAVLSAPQLRLLAACAFFTGDNQGAANAANILLAQPPHSLEALYWSIQANERLAFRSLARFQDLEPDSARSHVLLGDIYHQLDRPDDAQAEYSKALALVPGDPAAMLGLATVYLSNNNSAGAMEIAQAALLHSPNDPELNLIVAEALIGQRQYAEAEPYLNRSLSGKPQMIPRIHALMGKVYAETGRTHEAIEQLKLGAPSDEDGSVEYLLARLYRQIGDTRQATDALNRMKTIKQQRDARGFKQVQDPDLAPLESSANRPGAP
jgi:tetratricopeptide (TPR) repeat protein